MRVLFAILTCCLLIMVGQANAQLRPQGQTVSKITQEQFASILKDAGYSAKVQEKSVTTKVNGYNILVWFYGCGDGGCGAYGLSAFFKDKTTLEKANKFNGSFNFLKAIMTKEGIRIDMDATVQGGVSSQNIVTNVELFSALLGKAAELVE